MESPFFIKNQIVFARIRGYPCWPGKIYNFSVTSKVVRYIVYLYGFDRLMKFNATELVDYGDYIRKNTYKICDLMLYVRAIEDAQKDFCLSQIQSSPKEASITDAAEEFEFPKRTTDSKVENGKSYPPLLRSLVKKIETAEDPEYLDSQQSDGDLGELHTELKLLRYDYQIKSYASVKRVNLKKCLSYLCRLQKLCLNAFVLNRNPQILQTLERLQEYTGDSSKWKLTSKDRENFVRITLKIRKLANVILKSLKQISNQNNCCLDIVTANADANNDSAYIL